MIVAIILVALVLLVVGLTAFASGRDTVRGAQYLIRREEKK